jgi:hypothetical protein
VSFDAEKHLEKDLYQLNYLLASIGGWPLLRTRWTESDFRFERLYASVRGNYGLNTIFGLFFYPLPADNRLNTFLYVSWLTLESWCSFAI